MIYRGECLGYVAELQQRRGVWFITIYAPLSLLEALACSGETRRTVFTDESDQWTLLPARIRRACRDLPGATEAAAAKAFDALSGDNATYWDLCRDVGWEAEGNPYHVRWEGGYPGKGSYWP